MIVSVPGAFLSWKELEGAVGSKVNHGIDTRDVLFFVSLTIAGLTLSFQAIEARRWN